MQVVCLFGNDGSNLLEFWSSGVEYINLKQLPIGKGKIMEILEKCGFSHDFA
jgi:hypothetical protein